MIHIRQFGGMNLARSSWLIEPLRATVAHNALLRDGTLRAFRAPQLVRSEAYDVQTLHLPADGARGPAPLMSFPFEASVTEGPANTPDAWDLLVVWPQNGDDPFWVDRYDQTVTFPLIVPQPTKALTLNKTLSVPESSAGPDQRAWTYTWVDQFGVESLPAPPSETLLCTDGDEVELRGFLSPPANATHVNIYRTSGHLEEGNKPTAGLQISFQLVEQVALPLTEPYLDARRMVDMTMGTLLNFDGRPVPYGMGRVVITDGGYYVGFRGNEVFVSERHEPWNWPEKYRVSLPDEVVSIAASAATNPRTGGTSDTVYAATTGRPYRIGVSWVQGPENTSDCRVNPAPFEEMYPCIGRHTMVTAYDSAVYATARGLVQLRPSGPAHPISYARVDEDFWATWRPQRAAWLNGRYFGARSPAEPGFIYNMRTEPEGGRDLGDFVGIDLPATAIHAGHDGRVYYANGAEIFVYEGADEPTTYVWRSKEFVNADLHSLGAAKVMADYGTPVVFRLIASGRMVYTRTVNSSRPFRLPSLGKHLKWQVELEGSTTVREVHAAVTVSELADRRTDRQNEKTQ